MSDSDWGDIESLPEAKSGPPTWMWFCGCGCLVVILLAIAATTFTYNWVQEGQDSQAQWQRIGEVLPYDEDKLGDYRIVFGQSVPLTEFGFVLLGKVSDDDAEGEGELDTLSAGPLDPSDSEYLAILVSSADATEAERYIRVDGGEPRGVEAPTSEGEGEGDSGDDESGDDESGGGEYGGGGTGEEFTIVVQGRELVAHRQRYEQNGMFTGPQNVETGSSISVDITPEGSSTFVQLILIRQGSDELVPVEEVVKFLEPFHVGPDR